MIVVRIMGGLGNQLFEYAAGRRLAIANNDQLKLDVSTYKVSPRPYRLDRFNIVENIASLREVEGLTGVRSPNSVVGRIHGRLQNHVRRLRFAGNAPAGKERSTSFQPEILTAVGDVYLNGYWQSELYFREIENIIRKELTLKELPDSTNQNTAAMISTCESVSLHVRRGDYVSNPLYNQVHGTCALDYYQAALKLMTETVKEPHLFVFSDDLKWAKDNLKLKHPATYLGHNGEEKDYEDLRLMSLCKHHIIANSSFSWWGAWLCVNPGKSVIAPKTWFNDLTKDASDIVPSSWLRV
jgi:hypothetical protein